MEKPIYIFNKPRSKKKIEIYVNWSMDPGGSFIDVKHIEKKSGKVTRKSCIVKKDLEIWVSFLESEGWVFETIDNQ